MRLQRDVQVRPTKAANGTIDSILLVDEHGSSSHSQPSAWRQKRRKDGKPEWQGGREKKRSDRVSTVSDGNGTRQVQKTYMHMDVTRIFCLRRAISLRPVATTRAPVQPSG